jgi:DNA-binding FadR family transcriptional regulator
MSESTATITHTVTHDALRETAPPSLGRKPLFQEIQSRIRSYIFERGLRPGDMLPPAAEMASYLGVSHASLREGLRAMEALGMLETRHGIGTFVCSYNLMPIFETLSFSLLFDNDGLYKLIQIREAIEVGLIQEVVTRIGDEDLRRLEELCEETVSQLWEAGHDIEFHRALYRCLENELVAQILDVYWMTSTKVIDRSAYSPSDKEFNRQEHCDIVTALKSRDANAAVKSMRKHFADAKARLQKNVASVEA